jgi:colicin import membrane protein
MSEQKESSVLFSLKELMGLEEDRIREEEAEKEAAARAANEARLAAERAARDAEEARIRAEEEERQKEESRRKEEAARLEAIRVAEIERARVEADHHAHLASVAAQQQHEAAMAALSQDRHKKRLQIMVGVIGGVLLIGGVAATVLVQQNKAESERRSAVEAASRKEAEEKLERLQKEFELAAKKEAELTRQLAGAKDEVDRARIQNDLDKAKKEKANAGGGIRGGATPKSGGGQAKPACNPNDPLCGF